MVKRLLVAVLALVAMTMQATVAKALKKYLDTEQKRMDKAQN